MPSLIQASPSAAAAKTICTLRAFCSGSPAFETVRAPSAMENVRNARNYCRASSHYILFGMISYLYLVTLIIVVIVPDTVSTYDNTTKNALMATLTLLVLKTLYTLQQVHYSDPGFIPAQENFQSNSSPRNGVSEDVDRKHLLGKQPSEDEDLENVRVTPMCDVCGCIKPLSAHHCKKCNRCVEGMDHHCGFINNCVGVANRRLFLLFLFWALLSCINQAVLSAAAISAAFRWRTEHPNGIVGGELTAGQVFKWVIFSHGSVSIFTLIPGLAVMFVFHLILAASDLTTLEWISKSHMPNFMFSQGRIIKCILSPSTYLDCMRAAVINFNKTCRKRTLAESCNPLWG